MTRTDRVTLVIFISFITTFLTITNAFILKKQFYPAVVYLTKNNGSVTVLYFQGAVLAYLFFSFVRWIFFGQLRVAEVELCRYYLCLPPSIAIFVSSAYFATITKGASVQIVFGFEYAVLLTVIMHIAMKYLLHINDLRSAHPWEAKAVYMLYTELIVTFFRCILYFLFAIIMIRIHTFPLFAIRPFYLTLRSFKKAVNDVIQSRRAINAMNNLYPLATEQELSEGDNTCIICREEMTVESGAKKLPCNHIFHPNCLRPTCRTDVLGATRERLQPQANGGPQPPEGGGGDNLAALLAGLGFPQLQQARMLQQMQQGRQRQEQNQQQPPNQAGNPGIRVEFGFGNQPQQQGQDGTNAQTAAGPNSFFAAALNPLAFPTPYPFPEPATYAGLSDIELAQMEGRERAACEARLQALRNVQTLLDAASLQFQQYLATAPSVSLQPTNNTPSSSTNPDQPTTSTSNAPGPSSSTVTNQTHQAHAGETQAVE
ncbi:RING-type E3 ubiquitin transferase [Aphelenchoides bicaudatus]|nr:RING-type E3 ubiquitin transferase [Aphelenchoides bicaudatus]